jgi:hypothetical protein
MGELEHAEEQRVDFGRSHGIVLIPWILVSWAVRALPATARSRYREEFSAELVDLSPAHQVVHAMSLLRSSHSLARDLRPGPAAPAVHRRHDFLAPLAAVAAALAIIFAGLGLAARDAQPGDTLWDLTRILYREHARSVEGAATTRSDLRKAEAAITNGRIAEAKPMLDQAQDTLPSVSIEDGKAELAAQHAALIAKLDTPSTAEQPR